MIFQSPEYSIAGRLICGRKGFAAIRKSFQCFDIGMVRDDAFLELVMDCYAWAIWQFLKVPGKDGEYKSIPGSWENYSG